MKKASQVSYKEQAIKEQFSIASASVPAFRILPQVPTLPSPGDELLPGNAVRNKPLLSQVSFGHSNRKLTNMGGDLAVDSVVHRDELSA